MQNQLQIAPSAAVFQLAAALDRYQTDFEDLINHWFDRDRCRAVTRELDEIQKLRGRLPQFAADIVDVVIRHVELIRSLLRRSVSNRLSDTDPDAEVSTLRRRHQAVITAVRAKCLRLLVEKR